MGVCVYVFSCMLRLAFWRTENNFMRYFVSFTWVPRIELMSAGSFVYLLSRFPHVYTLFYKAESW